MANAKRPTTAFRLLRPLAPRITLALIGLTMILIGCGTNLAGAQSNATPVPLNLPTQAPTATPITAPTATGGTVTPIDLASGANGIVTVEAMDAVTGANVRQGPSADASTLIIGKILAGKLYRVIGKNGDWLEINYGTPTPDTNGWVYSKIVNEKGPLNNVPQVDPNSVPTSNPQDVAIAQTGAALALTPGAAGSATAQQASATGVTVLQPTATVDPTSGGPPVTFTFPPPFVVATLMPNTSSARVPGGVPPILPIAGFAALGVLGLLISAARRH